MIESVITFQGNAQIAAKDLALERLDNGEGWPFVIAFLVEELGVEAVFPGEEDSSVLVFGLFGPAYPFFHMAEEFLVQDRCRGCSPFGVVHFVIKEWSFFAIGLFTVGPLTHPHLTQLLSRGIH